VSSSNLAQLPSDLARLSPSEIVLNSDSYQFITSLSSHAAKSDETVSAPMKVGLSEYFLSLKSDDGYFSADSGKERIKTLFESSSSFDQFRQAQQSSLCDFTCNVSCSNIFSIFL